MEATTKEEGVSRTILSARNFFTMSLLLLGHGSDLLVRNVLRCLAIVLGPELSGKVSALSA